MLKSDLNVESKFLNINGVNLHVIEKGTGPTVLFLHGFPDSWKVWRHQIPAFVEAGYRVIVPDLRGFGESDKPEGPEHYRMPLLVADVIGLLDELKIEKTDIVCHDWGAGVGWALASNYPERVNRFVPIGAGHPKYERSFTENEKIWYIYYFQFEGVAEENLMKDDWSLFRRFTREHPELETWIEDLSRPGALTSALNWYRGNFSPKSGATSPMETAEVKAPTLGIFPVHDPYLDERRMLNSEKHITGPWKYERVEHAGHWLQLDRPEYLNKLLLEFLTK